MDCVFVVVQGAGCSNCSCKLLLAASAFCLHKLRRLAAAKAVYQSASVSMLTSDVLYAARCVRRELLAHPEICQGQQVLELGSGTGLVGLVAALAGAQQVRTGWHALCCAVLC